MKLPSAVMVRAMVVVAVSEPDVPVIVTVEVPAVTEPPAVKVTTLVEAVGLVAKLEVTPVGRPEAARVTLPVKPFMSVTMTVSVPLVPWTIDNVEAEGASVKLAAAVTVSDTAFEMLPA